MRVVLAAALFATSVAVLPAAAQMSNSPPQANPQQERMRACNSQAGSQKLTGDARKTFMSDCLSGKSTAQAPKATQQQKMKDCNASAAASKLSGDSRRQFMSNCLRGSGG